MLLSTVEIIAGVGMALQSRSYSLFLCLLHRKPGPWLQTGRKVLQWKYLPVLLPLFLVVQYRNVLNNQHLNHLPQKTLWVLSTKRFLGHDHLLSPNLIQLIDLGTPCISLFLAPKPASSHPLTHLSFNHYTPLRYNHSVQEFHPTEEESRELHHVKKMAFLFIALR